MPLITKAPPPEPADPGQFWVGMEYLAWSVTGDKLPPLVTTSPAGTPLPQAGVLGAAGTTVLFGNSSVNDGWRSGGGLTAGYWFDPQHRTGIEASFYGLECTNLDRISCEFDRRADPGAAVHRRHHQFLTPVRR